MDWDPSIKRRQEDEDREREGERQKIRKQTDAERENCSSLRATLCGQFNMIRAEVSCHFSLPKCLHQLRERSNERARAGARDDSAGVQSKRIFDNDPGAAKIGSLRRTTHLHCPNTQTWAGSLSKINFPPCPFQHIQPSLDKKKKSVKRDNKHTITASQNKGTREEEIERESENVEEKDKNKKG